MNACRHTPVGTLIEVVASVSTAPASRAAPTDRETAGSLSVAVIDHGPGVDANEQEKIFLPLYRADPSRSRDHPDGAGLGLAVTRQIALDTGGSVILHETPGGGATFELRLPLSG